MDFGNPEFAFCCNYECPIRQSCGRGDFSVIKPVPGVVELVSMAMWEPKKNESRYRLLMKSLLEACGHNTKGGFYQCDGYLQKGE